MNYTGYVHCFYDLISLHLRNCLATEHYKLNSVFYEQDRKLRAADAGPPWVASRSQV
jgi:hypothetical protein